MGVCDAPIGGFSTKACLLWLSYINSSTRYFEWGSGFTTRVADKVASRVTSIEGSRSWFEDMKKHNFSGRTKLIYVDVGKTGSFSWPENKLGGHDYIRAIKKKQDVILVDGRWRVACAIQAFSFLDANGKLMIHDFGRKQYQPINLFYKQEIVVDDLAVFRKRDNVSEHDLHTYRLRFEGDPQR